MKAKRRKVRGKVRHPEFRPTGDPRSDALQRLALDHMKRKQREARASCVYDWTAGPGGDCDECGTATARLFTGRPPIHLTTLPRAENLCSPCAAAFENLGRQRRDEECKSET